MAADDKLAALERLAKLKADGIITEAEFAAEKAAVLAGRTRAPAPLPVQFYAPPPPALPPTVIYAPSPPRPNQWRRIFRYGALAFLISLGVEASRYVRGGASGAVIATCDSQDARDVLKDAIEHSAAEKLANLRLLDISHMVERSYDPTKAQRICAADVTLNTGDEHLGYRLYRASNGRALLLETMDDPGPSAPPATAATAANPTSADASNRVGKTLAEMATTAPNAHGPPLKQQELLAAGKLAQSLLPPEQPLSCIRNPDVSAESALALTCVNGGRRYTMPESIGGLPTSYHLVDHLPDEGVATAPSSDGASQ